MSTYDEFVSDMGRKILLDNEYLKLLITELVLSVADRDFDNLKKISLILGFSDQDIVDIIRQVKNINLRDNEKDSGYD